MHPCIRVKDIVSVIFLWKIIIALLHAYILYTDMKSNNISFRNALLLLHYKLVHKKYSQSCNH